LPPVNAAHEFTPTDDLPDETFRAVQRHAASAPFFLDRPAHFQRIEQPQIEVDRDHGVAQKSVAAQHGILIPAKIAQSVAQEMVKGGLCIGSGRGEPERLKIAEVIGKAARPDRVRPA
jgi:hypothetical protein